MGQVRRRLIFDTSVLIEYERARLEQTQFDDDDVTLPAVVIAEFREGAERADTPQRRDRRLATLVEIRAQVDVLSYTEGTAVEHAKLLAVTRGSGKPRGRQDLILAAHAAETGRTIVSNDAAPRFRGLPGVTAIEPSR